jgi:D-serine deaminase-like pyridoxal phosphate-dependent protein
VQTPFRVESPIRIQIGDPIFCRPAKTGEICEHFNECILIQNNRIQKRVKTYRGFGVAFY